MYGDGEYVVMLEVKGASVLPNAATVMGGHLGDRYAEVTFGTGLEHCKPLRLAQRAIEQARATKPRERVAR
jgi:hypothetical protein